ncbi:MAG: hypothetical protein K2K17_12960 [Lachnospiraceae bacterium]|nr:hypothetical protein [Lachnospiraceae bacterium]
MKKRKNTIRSLVARVMSLVMAVVMVLGGMPSIPARAEDGTYPYMIFAASDEEGAVAFLVNNAGINGNVATNGTIAVTGGNCNINGIRTERARESDEPLLMPDLRERIINTYFAAETEEHAGDYALEEININVNTPIEGDGEISLTGNINLNAGIMAQEDIVLDGEVKNSGDVVLYSVSGNVVINSTNVNLNGLVYAPYGEIRITSMNVNMNNVILIAQKVTIEANGINGGMNQGMAQFIGTEYNVIESETGNDHPVNPDNPDPENPDPVDPENPDPIDPNNPEIDWSVDTDGDGLPDALEEEIGIDPEVSDTDGDGLSDYEEIFITGTDPLNPSSVQSGVLDGDADSDGDGIPNREELDKGLNPASADSDYDGLSDYDELYVYGTDPVNADSDGDGIKDGDEISLGLDPLNGSTNGVPDGEYMIHQTVDVDSEALAEINTADSPYRMSIEVDAAGYVAGNLDARETPYAHTIGNDAILGNAVGLEYQDGNVESVTLKFEIAEAYRENEIGMFPGEEEIEGIKRLNVFKYFEDINMLLPIETKFDMENHIVYTEVDEFGTYCLMDLEKWLLNFDLAEAEVAALSIDMYEVEEEMQPEEGIYFGRTDEYNEEDSIWQEGEFIEPEELESLVMPEEVYVMEDVPMLMALDLEDGVSNDIDNSNIDNASIDIVFILQCAGSSPADFQRQKDMIVQVAQKLETNHPDASVRIGVLAFQSSIAYWLKSDGEKWFTSSASLKNVLSNRGYSYTYNNCRISQAFELFCKEADLREDAAVFVYTLYNGNTGYSMWDFYTQHSVCKKFDVYYSEIIPKGYKYASEEQGERIMTLIEDTKGICLEVSNSTADKIYEHIQQNAAPAVNVPEPTEFTVVLPTGWTQITLTQPLDPANGANSDTDSLTDWEEVNTDMISWSANGELVLPTIYECMQIPDVSYVQSGLERFFSGSETAGILVTEVYRYMDSTLRVCKILPIYSNPIEEDTDGEGILDGFDIRPMKCDNYADKYIEFINAGYIDMNKMIQTRDGFTICMTPLPEILLDMGYEEYAIDCLCNGSCGMSEVAADWYLYSVETDEETVFSLIKLRDTTGYNTMPSVSVPFIELDIDQMQTYSNSDNLALLDAEFRKVINQKNADVNYVLSSYFEQPKSDALYVIPQIYVRLVIQKECIDQNTNIIYMTEKVSSRFALAALKKYKVGNSDGNPEIYDDNGTNDKSDDYIVIVGPYNPTLPEQECILAMRSGNPSFDSFAAEIVYHAERVDDPFVKTHTITADLSVGDQKPDEYKYKKEDGTNLKLQIAVSGGGIPNNLILKLDWSVIFA